MMLSGLFLLGTGSWELLKATPANAEAAKPVTTVVSHSGSVYNEAPQLAALVAAGELPPVERVLAFSQRRPKKHIRR